MSGLTINANVYGIKTVIIQQLNIISFNIEFDSSNVNTVYASGYFSFSIQLPSNVHMTYNVLSTNIDYKICLSGSSNMGQVTLNNIPVQHNQTTNQLFVSFNRTQLIVLNNAAFQDFAANLIQMNNISVTITGSATALIKIQIGNITLSDIPINDTVSLFGYNQFANGLLNIDEIDITGASSSNTLSLTAQVRLNNPSVINILYAGRLTLNLWQFTNGSSLGSVVINPFYLEPQVSSTNFNASGTFLRTTMNSAVVQQFISSMVSGQDNYIQLLGLLSDNSIGTSIPLLSTAIANLKISTKVPGLVRDRVLLQKILIKQLTLAQITGITLGLIRTLTARIQLKNPFSTLITVTSINVRADYSAVVNSLLQVGTVTDNTNIPIGAHQQQTTSDLTVNLTGSLSTLISLLTPLLAGSIGLSVSGFVNITIDGQYALIKLPVTFLNVSTTQDPMIG